ncbi:hypothetical protein QTH25_13220 [Clostridium perfringens]|uniref:hypothetical protein n=1 Tax=Clostridium perfringens TaxID=1502 RepID=UPI00338DAEFA|nr:hypothetical protein [Clostridium perfringens]
MSDREVKFYLVSNFRNGIKIKLEQLQLLSKYNKIKNNVIKYGGIIDYLQSLGFIIDKNKSFKQNEFDEYLTEKRKRLLRYI